MKKPTKTTIVAVVSVCLLIGASLLFFIHVQSRLFKPKVFRNPDRAMQFIRSKPNLLPLWQEFGIEKRNGKIVELVGVNGVMQWGSHFYAQIQYDAKALNDLMTSLSTSKPYLGKLKLDHIAVDIEGQRYDYNTLQGGDGPVSFLIIDPDHNDIIHYYAYGGDGG